MKLLPKFNIEKEENYQTIIKNFYLKENFFRKYLKKNIYSLIYNGLRSL